ncbi:MAG: zinc-binding dehydrogenase [Coriobacteriales bacterium]
MAKMKAMVIPEANKAFELKEVDIPEPQAGEVLLKIEACGVCHGDSMAVGGMASSYPRIPGHEVVGSVEALGDGVDGIEVGSRVGIGWHAGNGGVTGLTRDGGYAEYMTAIASSLVSIPEDLSSAEAAPLLCAGQTVFSALRNSSARPGDLVAILGIGGLGHLAVQYAHKSGFEVAAISRGDFKRQLATELGADHYIDNSDGSAADQLKTLGGAQVLLVTSANPEVVKPLIAGMKPGGEIIFASTSTDPIGWSTMDFIGTGACAKGTFTNAEELERTLKFSTLFDVKPRIETFRLDQATEAYDKMMTAKTKFRGVLVMQ